jgi:hypothetical protein
MYADAQQATPVGSRTRHMQHIDGHTPLICPTGKSISTADFPKSSLFRKNIPLLS